MSRLSFVVVAVVALALVAAASASSSESVPLVRMAPASGEAGAAGVAGRLGKLIREVVAEVEDAVEAIAEADAFEQGEEGDEEEEEEEETASSVPVRAPMWGPEGHQIVGSLATSLLNSAALSACNSILGGQTLEQVSTWADEIKGQDGWQWSKPLHYINTPDWACNYDHARDCADDVCVAGAIMNFTSQLTSTQGDQLEDALMFVVHFIGDIHQPLHVGFTSDEGGNTEKGTFEGEDTNLHQIWDSHIITTRANNDFNGDQDQYTQFLLQQIQGPWAAQAKVWGNCTDAACPTVWANEAVALACSNAYVEADGVTHISDGFDLEDDYYQRNYPIVDMQLAKAGVRLATSLNLILGSSSNAVAEKVAAMRGAASAARPADAAQLVRDARKAGIVIN